MSNVAVKQVAAKFAFVSRRKYVQDARHVLRALLRESSYLPDAKSRVYIKMYIKWRFRNTSERTAVLLPQVEKPGYDEVAYHEAKRGLEQDLRKAYRGLYQLIRANEGEIKPISKILRLAYGRSGPRRYELMGPLLAPDVELTSPDASVPPSSTAEDPVFRHLASVPIPAALNLPTALDVLSWNFTIKPAYSRLSAIWSSQSQKNIESSRSRLPSKISVPAKNAWARLMPRKRVKNIVAARYAKVLDGILAPLPEHEWEELRAKAEGTAAWEGCRSRRARPKGAPASLTASDLEKLVHIDNEVGAQLHLNGRSAWKLGSKSANILAHAGYLMPDERVRGYWTSADAWLDSSAAVDSAYGSVLEDELGVQTLNKNLNGNTRGHRITQRFMQRLYMDVFKECPKLVPVTAEEKAKMIGSVKNKRGGKGVATKDIDDKRQLTLELKWKVVWGGQNGPINGFRETKLENGMAELFGIEGSASPDVKLATAI